VEVKESDKISADLAQQLEELEAKAAEAGFGSHQK